MNLLAIDCAVCGHLVCSSSPLVPSKNRPELVARMRAKGLTQREIADTSGVGQSTVDRDLKTHMGNEDHPTPVTNSRGQQRPATYARPAKDDVIDVEVVEDGFEDDDSYSADDYEPTPEPGPIATEHHGIVDGGDAA